MSKMLWKPSKERVESSNMYRFMKSADPDFSDYAQLYDWSISKIPEFWAGVWDFVGIKAQKPYERVVDDLDEFPGAKWFPGAELNFAENLLKFRDDRVALAFWGEGQEPVHVTYNDLYDQVARTAKALRDLGVKKGDRVAGFMPNMPQTIVAMLAAASLGAAWSSCSPDFGIKGVLDRFGQIEPRVLFTADGYRFKGKTFDSLSRVGEILKDLPSIEKVVVVPYTQQKPDISKVPNAVHYEDFQARESGLQIQFEQLPFMHPLYIMFTSGTTGLPKCMVQSAGGVLINQLKELVLHCDLHRDDTIFYFTTCGWMMWNWLVCSLAVGSKLVLFDGNPFHPDPGILWKMAQDEKISIFGTSAGYLSALQAAGTKPGESFDLSPLKAVLSTGSPLSMESFEYVYRDIKPDLQLASISGGSDINGCFVGGNPMGPVYSGEIQCRCLGMKVEAWGPDGKPVVGEEGEAHLFLQRPRRREIQEGLLRGVPRDLAARRLHHHNRARRGDHPRPLGRHAQPRWGAHRHRGDLPPGGRHGGDRRQPGDRPELEERRAGDPVRQNGRGATVDRRSQGQDQKDPALKRLPPPRPRQDRRGPRRALHPEHEEGRAGGQEGHRGQGGPEPRRPAQPRSAGLLRRNQGTAGRLIYWFHHLGMQPSKSTSW